MLYFSATFSTPPLLPGQHNHSITLFTRHCNPEYDFSQRIRSIRDALSQPAKRGAESWTARSHNDRPRLFQIRAYQLPYHFRELTANGWYDSRGPSWLSALHTFHTGERAKTIFHDLRVSSSGSLLKIAHIVASSFFILFSPAGNERSDAG